MNENMNRQQAELNERELENVSGGSVDIFTARGIARTVCGNCPLHSKVDRIQHLETLANYIMEHGDGSIIRYSQCPYYER